MKLELYPGKTLGPYRTKLPIVDLEKIVELLSRFFPYCFLSAFLLIDFYGSHFWSYALFELEQTVDFTETIFVEAYPEHQRPCTMVGRAQKNLFME